jgi:hypothetical protein
MQALALGKSVGNAVSSRMLRPRDE